MAKKKKAKLNLKQRKLVRGIVAGKTKRKAAHDAGIGKTPESSSAGATKELKKANVQDALAVAMDKVPSLNMDNLMVKLGEGVEAQETKFFSDKGKIVSKVDVVAWGPRKSFLDTALELRGAKRQQGSDTKINVAIVLSRLDSEHESRGINL